MRTPRTRSLLAALLALMMVLAACNGDNGETAADVEEDDAPLALDLDDADDEEAAEEEEAEEPVEEEAAFDLVAAVTDYTETIPEGWMFHRTIEDFDEARQVEGTMILDVRTPGEIEENGVIPGTTAITLRELGENLNHIPTDQPVIVVCAAGWRAGIATSALRMLGYDNVLGYRAGAPGWEAEGNELVFETEELEEFGMPDADPELIAAIDDFLTTIPDGWLTAGSAEDVLEAQAAGATIIDVRQPDEYQDGSLPDTISIPIRELAASDQIPTDTNVIVHCQSGWRAGLSIPIFHLLGYDNVTGFGGNFDALAEAGNVEL